jgi:Tol biopolymer transport system component
MNADGSGIRQLTHNSKSDGGPVWSPDGRKILFWRSSARFPDGLQGDVYVMNADGSGQRNLTRSVTRPFASDASFAWSPDGRRILFVRSRGGHGDIFVMNADGSGKRNLTRFNARE